MEEQCTCWEPQRAVGGCFGTRCDCSVRGETIIIWCPAVKNSKCDGSGGSIKPQARVFSKRETVKNKTATKQNNINNRKKTYANTVAAVACDRRTRAAACAVGLVRIIIIICISHDECYWNYRSWSYLARTRVNIVCDTYTHIVRVGVCWACAGVCSRILFPVVW